MSQEVIEIIEREVEVIEVVERGPQGVAGAAGTGLETLTTQGDILYQGATVGERLPIGSAGQILKVNSGATAPEWGAAPATGVTSVGITGSDGIEVDSGSPVTGSGSIALGVNAASLRSHINVADGANNYTHPNHSGDVTSVGDGATTIANDAVTNAKLANMAQSTLKGRATASTGDPEDLSASQVRTILNVADGATANTASSATPSALGTAAAGTATAYAREDHVHAMPTAAEVGAAATSHTHVSADITDATSDDTGNTIVSRDGSGNSSFKNIRITSIQTEPNAGAYFYEPLIVDDEGTVSAVGTKGPEVRTALGLGGAATADIGTGSTEVAAGDHGHGNINSSGLVGTTANLPLKTGTGGIVEAGAFGTGAGEFAEGNHTHGNLTNDGKVGSTSGLPLVTTTAGAVTTLALGTAGQVLTVNSGANGVEFAAASGGVTAIGASAADILSVSGSDIVADDANADRIVFWDDSESKLAYLEAGSGLSISGTTLTATSTFDPASPAAIGTTTPNTGAFTSLSTAPAANTEAFTTTGYSLTGSNAQSVLDLAGTWNTTGTPSAIKLNITDTASNANSNLLQLQIGGANRLQVRKSGALIGPSDWSISESSGSSSIVISENQPCRFGRLGRHHIDIYAPGVLEGGSLSFKNSSTILFSIGALAANDIYIRNGTNAQAVRIYNTVSAYPWSDWERLNFRWASNEFIIDTQAAGTGTLRGIKIGSATSSLLGFYGATPVNRPDTVADAATQDVTGSDTVDRVKVEADLTSCKNAINAVIDRLQELGLIA